MEWFVLIPNIHKVVISNVCWVRVTFRSRCLSCLIPLISSLVYWLHLMGRYTAETSGAFGIARLFKNSTNYSSHMLSFIIWDWFTSFDFYLFIFICFWLAVFLWQFLTVSYTYLILSALLACSVCYAKLFILLTLYVHMLFLSYLFALAYSFEIFVKSLLQCEMSFMFRMYISQCWSPGQEQGCRHRGWFPETKFSPCCFISVRD